MTVTDKQKSGSRCIITNHEHKKKTNVIFMLNPRVRPEYYLSMT